MTHRPTCGLRETLVTTTLQAPLGFLYVDPADEDGLGDRVWIYIYNADTVAFTQGMVIGRAPLTDTYEGVLAPVSTNPIGLFGVAQHTIAAGSYGFILREGIGEVLSDGTTTANLSQVTAAGGTNECTDRAANTDDSGMFATEADTGASTLVTCRICCRG
jgi:hypothetical protein